MKQSTHETSGIAIRPLAKSDLDAVIALDRAITGRPRRGYFERRLASALRDPRGHLQLAATGARGLVGFALARVAPGEYGRAAPVVLLESIGVDPTMQHAGIGRRMVSSLSRDGRAIVTQADWRDHAMLRFLAGLGFALSPRLLLERRVARMPLPATDDAFERPIPPVRRLRADDLDMVVRIDEMSTGRVRRDYFERKFDEALHESPIAVSLVVEDDGFVVGFAMARVDLGDFGHVEPTASLDTIGIHRGLAGKGLASALLTQMIDNLAALMVERLETEVAHDHYELMRFFHRFGFAPAQRLVFEASRASS